MGEIGKVIDIKGDKLVIRHKRTGACATCRLCIRGSQEDEMIMRAKNSCNANLGDFVEIQLQEGALISAMAIAYGVPLAGLVLGFGLGYLLFGDIIGFAMGLVLMGACYVFIKILDNKGIFAKRYMPVAIRVAVGNNDNNEDEGANL